MALSAVLLFWLFGQFAVSDGGRKDWWVKPITDDFHSAGRLTARQLKYIAESGTYGSILSIFCFDVNGGPICNGTCFDFLPSTSEYLTLAHVAGIPYKHLPCNITWNTMEGVEAVEARLTTMPKPVLVHCFAGYASSGLTLLYLLKSGQLTCDEVFRLARAIDYEYWNDATFVELASQLSACFNCCKEFAQSFTAMTASPTWSNYWQAKRVSECVYISGQIQRDHICEIKNGGFHTVVNLRRSSQEEVNLLNIKTGGVTTDQNGGRQLRSNLLAMVIDRNKPNSYISDTSTDNFESINECEFGDDIEYNETMERQYLAEHGIKYYHLPVGGNSPFDEAAFVRHYCDVKALLEADCRVLVHSSTGARAIGFALLYMAVRDGRSCAWTESTAASIGYNFSSSPLCQLITNLQSGRYKLPVCSTSTTDSPPTADTVLTPVSRKQCSTFGPWSQWSTCSQTCDTGTETRTRSASPPNCHTRPFRIMRTRVCRYRGCSLDSDPRLTRLHKKPCKAVKAYNVTQMIPDCSDYVNSVKVPGQRWCVGTTSNAQSVCAPTLTRTRAVKSRCFNRKTVLVAMNRRCGQVKLSGKRNETLLVGIGR